MNSKKTISVGLAGNPNCGKTSIFNQLTGLRQHVGNYPGVTVEKKTGVVTCGDYEISFIDLPGTYSLSAYSEDELVARNFIIHEQPDVIVNVLDASNLERNLYLTIQLLELKAPLILALNMSDVMEEKGHVLDDAEFSALLGAQAVRTVGSKGAGTEDLLRSVVRLYEGQVTPGHVHLDYGPEILEEVTLLESLLKKEQQYLKPYPLRWLALKLLERDPVVEEKVAQLQGGGKILKRADQSRRHLVAHFDESPEILLADRRYGFISGVHHQVMRLSSEDRHDLSDQADRFILSRAFSLPIFAAVMFLIFKFTFAGSQPFTFLLERFFEWFGGLASAHIGHPLIQSFVVDGIINGVGGVLSFFPLIVFMFFAITFFEDSGYMARGAFIMDKFMSRFGLHGKSFLPLMISTNGCAALGILASRTLDSPRDRLITMLVTPFMVCGAKLPVFALFIAAFFPLEYAAGLMFLMYVLSVAMALVCAWALQRFVFKGESEHFVMELPPYRLPSLRGLFLKTWERGRVFLKKAGTVILGISILIWAMFTFPQAKVDPDLPAQEARALQIEQSVGGRLARGIEPVFRPIGLEWKAGSALIAGVAAKEVIISTLGTLYSIEQESDEDMQLLQKRLSRDPYWSPLNAFAFLIFVLFYAPCFPAAAIFRKESGSRMWTAVLLGGATVLAWISAFIVYQGGRLLGLG
ncbi:MAG: ferrous iron transport protein B [Candidatus Omnitrophota bacterium]